MAISTGQPSKSQGRGRDVRVLVCPDHWRRHGRQRGIDGRQFGQERAGYRREAGGRRPDELKAAREGLAFDRDCAQRPLIHLGLNDIRRQHGDALPHEQRALDRLKIVELGADMRFDAALAQARADADYTAHAARELGRLNPQPGEEQKLAEERALLTASEKIAGELAATVDLIAGGDKAIDARLAAAQRRLERLQSVAQGLLDPAIEAMARAAAEAMEARAQAEAVLEKLAFDPVRLEKIDDRLQALRDAARKYRTTPDNLPELAARFASQVRGLEDSEGERKKLSAAVSSAKVAFDKGAAALSAARRKTAERLGEAVAKELKPLKLERAQFGVQVEGAEPSASGIDRVEFLLATTPGATLQPLTKIASGGELARIVLALKVALLQRGSAPTLIFDEVDQGIGGAVADAVGLRLKRLAQAAQVIVVTHSPQVAARANHHFRISKRARGASAETRVEELDASGRREEIARMLSGATITEEARAAADRLMEAGRR